MARPGRKLQRKWAYAKVACPHCGEAIHVSIEVKRAHGTAG